MFKDNNAEEGFPRPVSDFGLPADGIDAALSRPPGDKTYFFKDQLYWCFDEHTRRLDPGHPAPSPPWTGLPSTLDAAMHWSDGECWTGQPGPHCASHTPSTFSHPTVWSQPAVGMGVRSAPRHA